MKSFHNDPVIKAKYISRVRAHRKADELVRGMGWDNGKGCAVGCTLEAYDHGRYPIELGIPEWLARLEDTLFEGMSQKRAMLWPEQFLAAIPLGISEKQFERLVEAPFIVIVLKSTLSNFDNDKHLQVTAAINGSIALWQRSDLGSARWEKARSAAESAAWSAAWSAARSAAWSAAESAAWSAAWSAARSAAYNRFAAELLKLLKSLPKGAGQ
jgi:hypothetical protein